MLFVIASEAKQSLSKPQLFSEVSIELRREAGNEFYIDPPGIMLYHIGAARLLAHYNPG